MTAKRYILTGAPGSGKTALIKQLEQHGYNVIHEAATDVIGAAQSRGVEKPWEEAGFVDNIAMQQRERQQGAQGSLQFYDRSPFCTCALGTYLASIQNIEFLLSQLLNEEIERCLAMGIYQPQVFLTENLGFIEHTAARRISFEDAKVFEKVHVSVYTKFGFELIFVPAASVAQRSDFVLQCVQKFAEQSS